MVRATIASLSIPSFLPEGASSSLILEGHQALLSRDIPLSYPTGKTTLQLGGIHLRLLRKSNNKGVMTSSRKPSFTSRGSNSNHDESSFFSYEERDGMIGFLITVKAVVRGELKGAAIKHQEFIIGACGLGFTPNTEATELTEKKKEHAKREVDPGKRLTKDNTDDPARSKSSNSVPYAKRVVNALAWQEQRNHLLRLAGAPVPLSSSTFLRFDLRVQTERVKLVLEVHLLQNPHNEGGRRGFAGNISQKQEMQASRGSDKGSETGLKSLRSVLTSCGLEVAIVGTVSPLV